MADPFENLLGYSQAYAQQQMATDPWSYAYGVAKNTPSSIQFSDPYKGLALNALSGLAQGFASVPMQRNLGQYQSDAFGTLLGAAESGAIPEGTSSSLMPYAKQVLQDRLAAQQAAILKEMQAQRAFQRDAQLEHIKASLASPTLPGAQAVREAFGNMYGQRVAPDSLGVIEREQPAIGIQEAPEQRLLELNRTLPADQAKMVFQLEQEQQQKGQTSLSKYITEEVPKLQKAEESVTYLEDAIKAAGATGEVVPGEDFLRERGLVASERLGRLFGAESSDASKRLAARETLNKAQIDAILAIRAASPGMGNMAVQEMEMLAKTGVSPNKSPSQNIAIANRLKQFLEIAKAQNAWILKKSQELGSFEKAQQLYMEHIAKNPVVIKDAAGNSIINPAWTQEAQSIKEPETIVRNGERLVKRDLNGKPVWVRE